MLLFQSEPYSLVKITWKSHVLVLWHIVNIYCRENDGIVEGNGGATLPEQNKQTIHSFSTSDCAKYLTKIKLLCVFTVYIRDLQKNSVQYTTKMSKRKEEKEDKVK